ncbi:MAG: sigma 54-interacting transcriptional regulator [Planctomycetales bacterium]
MTTSNRRRRALEATLANSVTPVFLLDARRRVMYFNAGCERLTGWRADEVLGRVCEYRTSAEPGEIEALTGSLCPPPEVLGGRAASVAAYVVAKDGSPAARRMAFFPLQGADGGLQGVLGVISPMEPAPPLAAESPARRLHAELASLRGALRQRYGLSNFVARGGSMRRVLEQIALARKSSAGVLLIGPRGAGKEHVARTIHYAGDAAARAFVPLDCRRTAPRELKNSLRRLLDGDEPPSPGGPRPTGALYLADVDHLPRDLQELLASAFGRERPPAPARVGDAAASPMRLMAATTRDPRALLDEESLLPELFYLVSTLTIELPPLAERPDDLPPLAQHFLEARNRGAARQIGGIDDAVWRKFREYNWPGNLDELSRVIAAACDACGGNTLGAADLPFRFRTGLDAQATGPAKAARPIPLQPFLEEVERERIRLALEQARDNKSKAAELLGITRPRLYRRMQALGIEDSNADEATGDR